MGICECGCGREIKPSRGSRRRFYSTACRLAYHRDARRVGDKLLRSRARRARPLFEIEIARPENQAKIAEALAWAEAEHPATPEAWGIARRQGFGRSPEAWRRGIEPHKREAA